MPGLTTFLLALLVPPSLAATPQPAHVRVVMETPAPTPFGSIRYEVVERAGSVSASHRRDLPSRAQSLQGMGLLTKAEAAALFDLLRSSNALKLPDATRDDPRLGQTTWRVEVGLDGAEHTFRVTDPTNQTDRRYERIIDAVRQVAVTQGGALPFRNTLMPVRSLGWIEIVAMPPGRVFIDGTDTQLETPVWAYEVGAGLHTVRLVTPDGQYDRTYQVRVEAGGTTRVAVDLR